MPSTLSSKNKESDKQIARHRHKKRLAHFKIVGGLTMAVCLLFLFQSPDSAPLSALIMGLSLPVVGIPLLGILLGAIGARIHDRDFAKHWWNTSVGITIFLQVMLAFAYIFMLSSGQF